MSRHSVRMERGGAVTFSGSVSSLFPWWSFSKTVLSICALRLVEEELLELDAPLPGKPFTLRQLLQHRTGLPDYGKLRSYHEAVARGDVPWPRDRLLAEVEADRLEFAPGTGWTYSDIGYMLVGEASRAGSRPAIWRELFSTMLTRSAACIVGTACRAPAESDFSGLHWPKVRSRSALGLSRCRSERRWMPPGF